MPAWFPRSRRAAAAPASHRTPEQPQALVAAATRLSQDYGYRQHVVRRQGWQTEAWRMYDFNGELRFAVEWMANSLSRVRLTVADVDDRGRVTGETTDQQVLALAAELISDPTCVSRMMHAFGQNLGVAGDVYLVYFDNKWLVLSVEQISDAGFGKVTIRYEGELYELELAITPVIRIHNPHPRNCIEANSATRGALPILRGIEELGKYRNAVVNSRLAGAGILGIASELSFARAPEDQGDDEDPFMTTLAEGMLTPISDQGDPSAVVPNVIRGPHEFLPTQANWLVSPAADLTTVTADLIDRDILRLATALDIPAEVLSGSGDSSRWATWQTEETAIKIHVEPMVILICAALTNGFLWPLLADAGIDLAKYAIWFDASKLIQRPNRGADAKDLYDKGLLSEEATRYENGFPEEYAPQGEEKCRATMYEVLRLSPRFADDHLDVVAEILGWKACGIDPAKIVNKPAPGAPGEGGAPDPGGTPKTGNPTKPAAQPKSPPKGDKGNPTAAD